MLDQKSRSVLDTSDWAFDIIVVVGSVYEGCVFVSILVFAFVKIVANEKY